MASFKDPFNDSINIQPSFKSCKTISSFGFSYTDNLSVEPYGTYGSEYEESYTLTADHIRQVGYELGIVQTCFPDITLPYFENRTKFPESYYKNTEKEKLALLQAENFRQQYKFVFPNRRVLVLAADNECGIQKLVCNTLRPTTLPYLELKEWRDSAKFVSEYINYEQFDRPTLPRKRK